LSSHDWFVALQTLLSAQSVATVQLPGSSLPSQADDAPEQKVVTVRDRGSPPQPLELQPFSVDVPHAWLLGW
jgi:hypothetical protein